MKLNLLLSITLMFIALNSSLVLAVDNFHEFSYNSDLGAAGPIGRGAIVKLNVTSILEGVYTTKGDSPQQAYVANVSLTTILANATFSGNYSSFSSQSVIMYANQNYDVMANGTWAHCWYTNGRTDNATYSTSGISVTWQFRQQCNAWPSCAIDTANGVMCNLKGLNLTSCLDPQVDSRCPGFVPPPSAPTFTTPTPANNTITTNVSVINVSCINSNVSLWADTNVAPVTPVVVNKATGYFEWTTNWTTTNYYYYKAGCANNGGVSANSTVYRLTYAKVVSLVKTCLFPSGSMAISSITSCG